MHREVLDWRACQFLMPFTVRVRELASAADD
jgi:hypothetical protein